MTGGVIGHWAAKRHFAKRSTWCTHGNEERCQKVTVIQQKNGNRYLTDASKNFGPAILSQVSQGLTAHTLLHFCKQNKRMEQGEPIVQLPKPQWPLHINWGMMSDGSSCCLCYTNTPCCHYKTLAWFNIIKRTISIIPVCPLKFGSWLWNWWLSSTMQICFSGSYMHNLIWFLSNINLEWLNLSSPLS